MLYETDRGFECRKGYIPIRLSDQGYLEECERERLLNMPRCRCSCCDPQGAARLIRLLPETSIETFDGLLDSYANNIEDTSVFDLPKPARKRMVATTIVQVCKKNDPIRMELSMIELAVSLVGHSERLFETTYPKGCDMNVSDLFTREEAWSIDKNLNDVVNDQVLKSILGAEVLPGLFNMIKSCITDWYKSQVYLDYQQRLADQQMYMDQEILNQELLQKERKEINDIKDAAKRLKSSDLAKAKILREEKAAAKTKKRKANMELSRKFPGWIDLVYTSQSSLSALNSFKLMFFSCIEPQVNLEVRFFLASIRKIFLNF